MAEIIGVVASGIAIGQATASITNSLLKLKEIWNQLRNAPEDLVHLISEIEIVHLVLAESEEQELANSGSRSRALQGALQLTNDAAEELQTLVDDLQTRLGMKQGWKKKIAAVKVVLERDQIKRYKSRLKRCLQLLMLAQNCKITAMLERQPAVLSMQLTDMTRRADNFRFGDEAEEDESSEISPPQKDPWTVGRSNVKASVWVRVQLFRRQWHLYSSRSRAGWDFGFRVFTIIAKNSEISSVFEDDNVDLLREMLAGGRMTPLTIIRDIYNNDYTLLACSVDHVAPKICQLLLNEGAKVVEESIHCPYSTFSPVWCLLALASFNVELFNEMGRQERLNMLTAMILHDPELSILQNDDNLGEDFQAFPLFYGNLSLFQQIQTCLDPGYYNSTFQKRAGLAIRIAVVASGADSRHSNSWCNSPDVFWAALGNIGTSELNQKYLTSIRRLPETTLLSSVAMRFGQSLFERETTTSPQDIYASLYMLDANAKSEFDGSRYPFRGWQTIVRQFVRRGVDLNLLDDETTALFRVIGGAYTTGMLNPTQASYDEVIKYPNRRMKTLYAWLETLQTSGVDLEEYGKVEILLQREEFSRKDIFLFDPNILVLDYEYVATLRLIGMEIGPNPQDWKFWFSDPSDQMAGEFWDMIEHPERSMPGAWDEFSW